MDFLISFIGGTLGGVALAAALGNRLLQQLLKKEMEQFKADLKLKADKKLAEYSANLEKDAMLLSIRYGGIYEKQAEALLELYQLLRQVRDIIFGYEDFKYQDTRDLADYLEPFFLTANFIDDKKPLLPSSVANTVDELLGFAFSDLTYLIYQSNTSAQNPPRINGTGAEKLIKKIQDNANQLCAQTDKAMNEITSLIRVTLGTKH